MWWESGRADRSGVNIRVVYSQLLAETSNLGLGVCQLDAEVLPALGAPHAGRVTGRLSTGRRRRRSWTLTAVSLLRQLYDRLWGETTSTRYPTFLHVYIMGCKNVGPLLAIQQWSRSLKLSQTLRVISGGSASIVSERHTLLTPNVGQLYAPCWLTFVPYSF